MKFPLPDLMFDNLPQAYLVGGSVRDVVRGAQPTDYDIVAAEAPLRYARSLADRLNGKVISLGKERFSVHRVVSENLTVDVTALKGKDIETDLMARDFTINALAWDLTNGQIIDRLDGMKDLQAKQVRMVSADAFSDDPARLVRAFRMAATMDFQIEPGTLHAIADHAEAISKVAGERIWAELELIVSCSRSLPVLRLMAASSVLFHIMPELRPMQGCRQNRHHNADVLVHTFQAYHALERLLDEPNRLDSRSVTKWISAMPPDDRVDLKFALLLHDTGKPETRSGPNERCVHFYGHAALGATIASRVCRRLRISRRHQDRIGSIVRHHQRPLSLFLAQQRSGLRPKTLGRFFRKSGDAAPYILIHAIADDLGKRDPHEDRRNPKIDFYGGLMEKYFETEATHAAAPLINGHDLIKIFELSPSPRLGRILNSIKELQMAGAITHREQALRWVADNLKQL